MSCRWFVMKTIMRMNWRWLDRMSPWYDEYGIDDVVIYSQRQNSLQWRHNGRDSVSNHQPHDCLLNRLFRRRSKKTSKLRVTSLCAGTSPVTGEFPAQMASNAENVSIWWRHHVILIPTDKKSALVQVMAWYQTGEKLLHEPMMT